jgi:hypothetical protein
MSIWIPVAISWALAAVNVYVCARMLRDSARLKRRRDAINELSRALLRIQEARLARDEERCEAWIERFKEIDEALLVEFPELRGPTK